MISSAGLVSSAVLRECRRCAVLCASTGKRAAWLPSVALGRGAACVWGWSGGACTGVACRCMHGYVFGEFLPYAVVGRAFYGCVLCWALCSGRFDMAMGDGFLTYMRWAIGVLVRGPGGATGHSNCVLMCPQW